MKEMFTTTFWKHPKAMASGAEEGEMLRTSYEINKKKRKPRSKPNCALSAGRPYKAKVKMPFQRAQLSPCTVMYRSNKK